MSHPVVADALFAQQTHRAIDFHLTGGERFLAGVDEVVERNGYLVVYSFGDATVRYIFLSDIMTWSVTTTDYPRPI